LKAHGNTKLKAGQAAEALAAYRSALARIEGKGKIPPGSAAASLGTSLNLNASLACLRLEDWEAAEDFATQALRMGRCSKGFYRRGLARVQLGVAADAKRDFESALEIEPKGEGALMVRAELEKLAAKGAGGTGFEAPEDADYHEAQRFEVANSAREQNGQRQVTWKEWRALQERIAARASHAHAWRKRLTEVTKCLPQDEGDVTGRASLTKLVDGLASKACPKRAPAGELVLAEEQALAPSTETSSAGIRGNEGSGVQFLLPGPWLFDGRSCSDCAFEYLANPSGSFSVEVWAACDGTIGHQCLLASRDLSAGKKAGYAFYVEPEGVWSFWVGTAKRWEKLYGSKVELGKWTQLRGTVDIKSKEARFYVDRHLIASRSWVDFVPNTKQPLRLGAGRSEGDPHFYFNGDLRDVAVLGRSLGDEDISEDLAATARAQERSHSEILQALQRLPVLLRQSKGKGLGPAQSALSSALRWASGVAVLPNFGIAARSAGSRQAEESFRRASLRFLESGTSVVSAEGVGALFITFNISAAFLAEGADAIRASFGGGQGQHCWALLLRSGCFYKLLCEVDGVCSLADVLSRQRKVRPQLDGWLNQKDAAMWLSAVDSLAFSLDASEVEDAFLTVFHFGYWASKTLSPQVKLSGFEASHRTSTVQAALATDLPREAMESLLQELTAEAAK